MKKTKLFRLVPIALISVFFMSCYITKDNIHKEVNASVDISTMHYSGSNITSGATVGFNAGFALTEDIENQAFNSKGKNTAHSFFSLKEGIEIAGKGTHENDFGGISSTNNIYYLELPATLNYNFKLSADNWLRTGLGVYLADAFYGHYSTNYGNGDVESGRYRGFNTTDNFASFDYGLRAVTGLSVSKNIDLYISYDFVLYNVIVDNYNKQHNRSIGLNISYRFR